MKHLSIIITGKVQGVFFRANAREVATNLGIKGYVRNESDGSVKIEAEGDEHALAELLDWCKKGPLKAKVEKVESNENELIGNYRDFEIRR